MEYCEKWHRGLHTAAHTASLTAGRNVFKHTITQALSHPTHCHTLLTPLPSIPTACVCFAVVAFRR